MDFDDLMAQARANEERVKKTKIRKTVNLEPSRPTQKIRAQLVQKQEEEKRRRADEEARIGRQEREKLARMEEAMKETERKIVEEQEKQDKLDQMHKEARERREKSESDIAAKREAARLVVERQREEERERKREEKESKSQECMARDDDIFRRRREELDAKERRRAERRREQDGIWQRRQEHKKREKGKDKVKERDKEKMLAKIREDARKVAQSLSRSGLGSAEREPIKKPKRSSSTGLMDLEEAKHLQNISRVTTSSSSSEEDMRLPPQRRRNSENSTPRSKHSSGNAEPRSKHSSGNAEPRSKHSSGNAEQYSKHSSGNAEPRNNVHISGNIEPRNMHSSGNIEPRTKHEQSSVNTDLHNNQSSRKIEETARQYTSERTSKPKVSDILGGSVDTAALSRALDIFIKFPDAKTDAETEPENQERLQELFGNESDSDEPGEERKRRASSVEERKRRASSVEERKRSGSESESEEEISPAKSAQERRNKLKELARKKKKSGYSDDSMSDYDHKELDTADVEEDEEKPKTFEELMEIANQKSAENKRELEMKKQKAQNAIQQKRTQELKRKQANVELELRRKEQERERQVERQRALERKEEKAKNRIPKLGDPAKTKPHPKKEQPKQKMSDNRTGQKSEQGRGNFKVPNGTSGHPAKRKKTSAPLKSSSTGSFEELMELANQNSVKPTFGSNIKKPEDVVREQRRKEIEKRRERMGLSGPSRPLQKTPPKQKAPAPRTPEPIKKVNRDRPGGRDDRAPNRDGKEERRRTQQPPKKKLHSNPYMDNDLDEFVVDDDENVDYSKAIRSMFGYDKRKYRDEEDDCRGMESDYRSIQREEARSSRMAKQEDAEELKKIQALEEREKRKKMKR